MNRRNVSPPRRLFCLPFRYQMQSQFPVHRYYILTKKFNSIFCLFPSEVLYDICTVCVFIVMKIAELYNTWATPYRIDLPAPITVSSPSPRTGCNFSRIPHTSLKFWRNKKKTKQILPTQPDDCRLSISLLPFRSNEGSRTRHSRHENRPRRNEQLSIPSHASSQSWALK